MDGPIHLIDQRAPQTGLRVFVPREGVEQFLVGDR